MIEFLTDYGLFLAKAVTTVIAILVVAGSLASLAMRHRRTSEKQLDVTYLNREFEEMENSLGSATLGEAGAKAQMKAYRKAVKAQAKVEKKQVKTTKKRPDDSASEARKRVFILDFDGDIRANNVESLRQEISAILTQATEHDEVVIRLESGGGTVHGYGLGASQLQRLRDAGIPLTVAVDKVAASGGYLMACVANRILSAPFAIIGSIGVLAQIPNLHRLLKKHDIDFEQLYAGEYKRTLTLFGENTDRGREKMQQDLEAIHALFKGFVKSRRPHLDIDKVATGEHWPGSKALELGLVDQLVTSDDYLMGQRNDADLIRIKITEKKSIMDKLSEMMQLRSRATQDAAASIERPLFM